MTPTRIREIFADQLRCYGEEHLADIVVQGANTSNISRAALKAMARVAELAVIEEQLAVMNGGQKRADAEEYEYFGPDDGC